MSYTPTPVNVDLTMSAAPFGWGGYLNELAELFEASLSAQLDPTFLIGQSYGTTPTHDIGPYFDGLEWWFFNPLSGQYETGEQGCPIGTVAWWGGGNSLPSNWLGCAGQNVSRRTFYRLFNAVGETWGIGDGQTTFGLPPGGKMWICASGFVGLPEVPIDSPASTTAAAPGAEASPPNQPQTYPNQGVGARGGTQLIRALLASDMPGLYTTPTGTSENSGLQATLKFYINSFNNYIGQGGVTNIPNIQQQGAPSSDGTISVSITDADDNPTGQNQTQVNSMPPFVAINAMIKYQ
jgi:hypothetical protein